MEHAILKTLIYSDIFDYPLYPWEIHKWLIQKKATLLEVEEGIKRLVKKKRIDEYKGLFFLKGRKGIVKKRLENQEVSSRHLEVVRSLARIFKVIPFIKLVGVSGSLAMKNSDKKSDIDLFLITQKKRLFLSRFLVAFLLEFLGIRRKRYEKQELVYKKICINILLDEDSLVQSDRNIYIAHEVLQMMPLWERTQIYTKYLEENLWTFDFLPNWLSTGERVLKFKKRLDKANKKSFISSFLDGLEKLMRGLQIKFMGRPKGKERILENELYFLPEDNQERVLKSYNLRIKGV